MAKLQHHRWFRAHPVNLNVEICTSLHRGLVIFVVFFPPFKPSLSLEMEHC